MVSLTLAGVIRYSPNTNLLIDDSAQRPAIIEDMLEFFVFYTIHTNGNTMYVGKTAFSAPQSNVPLINN